MTVSQLEGFVAGVLGHSSYRVIDNDVYLNTDKDVRKMCLALIKQHQAFEARVESSTWQVRVLYA